MMYLNQFHKEATERKIKKIAKSKQSPMNSADAASYMKHNLEVAKTM
jgi:ribosomal protein L11